jgi:hypothetical protein
MAKLPYYTSDSLIEAVKRNISFPIAQITFSEDDILRFADEEMFLEQVPSILQYHEEYFVFNERTPLAANQNKYSIPKRAVGMKVRDVFFEDASGQLIEMTRISPDDKSHMSGRGESNHTPVFYYVENNSIILTPSVGTNPTGTLVFSYYLRPNSLVRDERACVCQSFSKTIAITNSSMVAGDTISLGSTVGTVGTSFAIGVNDSTTANNFIAWVGSLVNSDFTASTAGNLVTVRYTDRNAKISTSKPSAFNIQSSITLNTTNVPSDIVAGSLVDILQTEGGHSSLAIDVKLIPNSVSLNGITLTEAQLPKDFIVGDYICARYECIIPQIPTDLHMLLGERTAVRILQSIGDRESAKAGTDKIDRLEAKQSAIIDNRSEGAPLKVVNNNGLLKSAKVRFNRRGLKG